MKTFEMKTVIHFGDNALDRLAELPYKKVLVITDPFIAKGEMINLITDPLRRGGKEFEVSVRISPLPHCLQQPWNLMYMPASRPDQKYIP